MTTIIQNHPKSTEFWLIPTWTLSSLQFCTEGHHALRLHFPVLRWLRTYTQQLFSYPIIMLNLTHVRAPICAHICLESCNLTKSKTISTHDQSVYQIRGSCLCVSEDRCASVPLKTTTYDSCVSLCICRLQKRYHGHGAYEFWIFPSIVDDFLILF